MKRNTKEALKNLFIVLARAITYAVVETVIFEKTIGKWIKNNTRE